MYANVYFPVAALQKAPVKVSGMCSIKIFRKEDVLAWPAINPVTGVMDTAISLKPGKFIYSCPLIDQTRLFDEEPASDDADDFFNITVKGNVPGSNASNILSLQTMRYHQWGIIAEDRSGIVRLVGNEDSCAKLSFKYGSGTLNESRKTELVFKWQHSQSAPIYTAETFTIIIGGIIIQAGCLQKLMQFKVGAPGAPMDDTDTELTDVAFANKRLLVLADGIALPIDYGDGAIDWSGSISRHLEKPLAGDNITFIGGVIDNETIEVYAF